MLVNLKNKLPPNWPLFATENSFPHYAWTLKGREEQNKENTRKKKQNEILEQLTAQFKAKHGKE